MDKKNKKRRGRPPRTTLKESNNKGDAANVFDIDRDAEDKMVEKFQKTGDTKLLEKLYKQREPTLNYWAHKEWYQDLSSSPEDLRGEFMIVFIRAVQKYNKKRGHFNTCLFTFLLNRLKNIKNSNHAKKRVPEGYTGSISSMLLSLDYNYKENDGNAVTLKDIISDKSSGHQQGFEGNLHIEDTIKVLSNDNKHFKKFLIKLSQGGTVSSVIKEYKTKSGNISLTTKQRKLIRGRNKQHIIKDIIKKKSKIQHNFNLIDYELSEKSISYTVELKNISKVNSIISEVNKIRGNKDLYLQKIGII